MRFWISQAPDDRHGPESPTHDRALRRELRSIGAGGPGVDVAARVLERVERSGAVRFSRRPRRVSSGPVAIAAAMTLAGLGASALRPWESGRVQLGGMAAGVDVEGAAGVSAPGVAVFESPATAVEARPVIGHVRTASVLELGSTRAYDGSSAMASAKSGAGTASVSEVTEVGVMAQRPPTREQLVAWAEAQRRRSAWMSWFLPSPVVADDREPAVARHTSEK